MWVEASETFQAIKRKLHRYVQYKNVTLNGFLDSFQNFYSRQAAGFLLQYQKLEMESSCCFLTTLAGKHESSSGT